MKVGIVGAGRVGSACALAMLARGSAREIVIVGHHTGRKPAIGLVRV
jgi:L-lactate dehydrogenase